MWNCLCAASLSRLRWPGFAWLSSRHNLSRSAQRASKECSNNLSSLQQRTSKPFSKIRWESESKGTRREPVSRDQLFAHADVSDCETLTPCVHPRRESNS